MSFEKKYYSIGEVADEVKLKEHVLRFWEKEFSFLSPIKNNAGHRKYTIKDINLIKKIKYLIQTERFTIPGARQKLLELKNKLFDDFNEEDFKKEIRKQDNLISNQKEISNKNENLSSELINKTENQNKSYKIQNEKKSISTEEIINELKEILKLL